MSIAEQIIKYGHAKDSYVDPDSGAVCMLGAALLNDEAISRYEYVDRLERTYFNYEYRSREPVKGTYALPSVQALLEAKGMVKGDSIPAINDADEFTYDDALRWAKEADEILDRDSDAVE